VSHTELWYNWNRYIEKPACHCWCGGHTSCRRNRHNRARLVLLFVQHLCTVLLEGRRDSVRLIGFCVSVLTDIFLGLVINHVLGLQLPFDYDMLLTPVVLTWYIATELGSILENAAEMGVPVPPVLREVLEKVHKASDRKDTTASAGHLDE